MNLGRPEYLTEKTPTGYELNGWHCDGDVCDRFSTRSRDMLSLPVLCSRKSLVIPKWTTSDDTKFLDSPEQALLIVPLWSDVVPRGGGTFIAPQAIEIIAKHLNSNRGGVMPTAFGFPAIRDQCTEFVELSGHVGDVRITCLLRGCGFQAQANHA